MALLDEAAAELSALARAQSARGGSSLELAPLLPVHTILCPADRLTVDTVATIGAQALTALARYGPDPHSFAEALGVYGPHQRAPGASERAEQARRFRDDPQTLHREDFDAWLIHVVHARVQAKLKLEAVEDLRVDFEGSYGPHGDAQEDAHAEDAAGILAWIGEREPSPSQVGLRIKPLSPRTTARAVRTLERFVDRLVAVATTMPSQLVVTLPRVSLPEQVATTARLLELLEARHGLDPGSIRMELLVETTRALFDEAGRCALPRLVRAAAGRCVAVHLGSEDLAQACGLAPELADGEHPLSDLARGLLRLALGATPVTLSDSTTGPLPEGPHPEGATLTAAQHADNRAAVYRAWQRGHAQILHALRSGLYQGWDRAGAQLPVRYAANYRFYLERFDAAAVQLRELLTTATSAEVLDRQGNDARRGQRLLTFIRRAHRCGALDRTQVEQLDLEAHEFDQPSFIELVAERRRRAIESSDTAGVV